MPRLIKFLVFTAAALGGAALAYTVVRRTDFRQIAPAPPADDLTPEQEEALLRELKNDLE